MELFNLIGITCILFMLGYVTWMFGILVFNTILLIIHGWPKFWRKFFKWSS